MRLHETLYIGLFDALPILRDPGLMLMISLLSFLPVLFIFVFAGTGEAALQSLVGAVVLTFAFTGLLSAQSVYFNKHWFRYQDMLVASRVSPSSYAMGISLGTLVVSAPAVLFSLVLLLLAKNPGVAGVGLGLAASLILWASLVFLGFTIGSSTRNVRRANSFPQILAILLGFLPPVYYPLDRLPSIIQPLALLIPTTHAAQLAKYYFGLLPLTDFMVVLGWVYLVGFTALMALLAVRKAGWVDR